MLPLGRYHFFEDIVETSRDSPTGEVRFKLAQVADVTDVIAFARLLAIYPLNFLAGQFLNARDRFEPRPAVRAPAAKIVNFARPRIFRESFHRGNHVVTVNIVADLFSLVAEE